MRFGHSEAVVLLRGLSYLHHRFKAVRSPAHVSSASGRWCREGIASVQEGFEGSSVIRSRPRPDLGGGIHGSTLRSLHLFLEISAGPSAVLQNGVRDGRQPDAVKHLCERGPSRRPFSTSPGGHVRPRWQLQRCTLRRSKNAQKTKTWDSDAPPSNKT